LTYSPNATDLIDIARQTLVERVLPALTDAHRYEGLMIANALGIALRELQAAEKTREAEQAMAQAVTQLLGAPAQHGAAEPASARLAAAIRAGRFDPGHPGSDTVKAVLAAEVRAQLAIDNPKALG
jgi:hypothetical protein